MSETAAATPSPATVQTEIDGVVAVYDAASDEVLVLSQSASDIWRLLDGARTEDDVVQLLASRYGVEPHEIASDVSAMLSTWTARGLLRPGGSDDADVS